MDGSTASYIFVSDGTVPEPDSVLLMAPVIGFLWMTRRFRKPER
jgi:hypothetical protein